MVTKAEDLRIMEKALNVTKKELSPMEYARFLAIITPKVSDSVREIRKFINYRRRVSGDVKEKRGKNYSVPSYMVHSLKYRGLNSSPGVKEPL